MVIDILIHMINRTDKRYDASNMLRAFAWTLFMLVSVPLPALAATAEGLTAVALSSKPITVTNSLWRISVKVFRDTVGSYPGTSDWNDVRDKFVDALDGGNDVLTFTERNVRLDLVEIITLSGSFPHVPSLNLDDTECSTILKELNQATKIDPSTYAYRKDAINVYYVDCAGPHNGVANTPNKGDIVVVRPTFGRLTLIHEFGHHFGLLHTHNGISADVADNCDNYYPEESFPRVYLKPGDDGLSDTVPDHPCWLINDMAINTTGVDYDHLMPDEDRVLNTYANLMSYHAPDVEVPETEKRRLTNEQLDLMFHEAASSRVREVAQEIQRVIDVHPYLSESDRNAERDQLINEFIGSWVAVEGDDHWVSSLVIRENPHIAGELIGTLESSTTTGWPEQVGFRPSVYTDALIAIPDPNLATSLYNDSPYTNLTYTVRMRYDNRLEVRVAAYESGAVSPFSEHKVILERKPEPIRATFQSRPKLP